MRVAVLRFVFTAHPAGRTGDAGGLAVRAIYSLTRTLEHNPPVARQLTDELEARGMTEPGHAACLIRL